MEISQAIPYKSFEMNNFVTIDRNARKIKGVILLLGRNFENRKKLFD